MPSVNIIGIHKVLTVYSIKYSYQTRHLHKIPLVTAIVMILHAYIN